MTGRPAALSAFAFESTASVADSAMAETRAEIRGWAEVMTPWWHLTDSDRTAITWSRPGASQAHRAVAAIDFNALPGMVRRRARGNVDFSNRWWSTR